jgi:TRAP-type mannitol/chloroaromatic compound transport system permease small subunit
VAQGTAARLAGAIDVVVDRIGQLSAVAVAALVVVMSANVLLRYGFSWGASGRRSSSGT